MKSSVRILAIALALAFLLLARSAFQDSTTANAEDIELKDGEASFADLIDGTQEAEYLGFNMDDGKTADVYFYIKSEDLGTQVTASTTNVTAASGVVTLNAGNAVAGTVATTSIATLLDGTNMYCSENGTGATSTVSWDSTPVQEPDQDDPVVALPAGWALDQDDLPGGVSVVDGDVTGCTRGDDLTAATTTPAARETMLLAIQKAKHDPENKRVQDANGGLYTYGDDDDAYTKLNPGLRYTHGTNEGSVGGPDRPLASVKATHVDSRDPANIVRTSLLTFVSNADGGEFQAVSDPDLSTGADDTVETELTFDIVDMYPAKDTTAADMGYKAYSSGFARAYVSSGSDSGQWVDISEVKAYTNNEDLEDDGSPTSNLFQGMVTIVNDTSLETDDVIYAQDGDTLTLTVVASNGKRSSDVLASATAMIDNSAPTISDLSPADDSVINDDVLRISFSVNDEGAGLDFKEVDTKKVVTKVEAQEIGDDGKGTDNRCELTVGDDDIGNAGGNASRVGVLIAPKSTDFTDPAGCADIVDVEDGGKFNLVITTRDLAFNVDEHTTQLTIDTEEPTVEGNPEAGNDWDEDKNESKSSANSILIKFSESLDADTVAAADFTVAGYTIDSVEVVGANDDDNKNLNKYVALTLTEDLAKNARPSVTVTGVNDVAGNAVDTTTRTSNNVIKAALTVVPFSALIAEDGQQAISFTSDEALRSKSGESSTEGSVGDGKVTITVADDTRGGNATFKESKYGGSRAYGVLLQAVDVDGNVSKAGEVKVSDEAYELTEDVVADGTFDVTLDNWPLADTGFDNEVAGEVKAYIGKAMVASSTGAVEWEGGAVTLKANAGRSFDKGDTINLSYSYVNADQVIQVDVGAPTMTSNPADNDETDYAAGAIQFIWSDDDKYAGDSYKTVTLNSAMHEGPSGTSTDILSDLTTHDNKTWAYRPSADLALGDHEFTVKATDAAGNSATESVTITVIERKPVKINLSPGWNLISLRGMPASTDVNDVFDDDTVTVVSQYDGRRVSPWTVWTRGEDGSLSSSPAGRTTIDSGLGLWVLSSDGSPLEVDIPGTSQDNPAAVPPSVELIPGWNLIAVIILDRDTKSVIVDDYLPEGVWSRAFKLDNTTGGFTAISPAPKDEDGEISVNAGQALWVYATQAGVVTPSK